MCGIFAYHGRRLDHLHLRTAAAGASRRGPHGHGWVACYPSGYRQAHHALGPLDADTLTIQREPDTVIGHTRLATATAFDDNAGLQPYLVGSSGTDVLVHNGVVHNRRDFPAGVTDSHQLALAYAVMREAHIDPATAVKSLVERAVQHAWVILVRDRDGHLYGHRHGHPLYVCNPGYGTYFSSQPCCPTAELAPELAVFTTAGGE